MFPCGFCDFDSQTSLYVHVPFCVKKCSYCAFYSRSCTDSGFLRKFTDTVCGEIKEIVNYMKDPFFTAFIGGGNPGCLPAEQLTRIARCICEKGRPCEFTVEMNPESFSEDYFDLFENYATRLSMGVQSLDVEALSFLGRNSSLGETVKTLELSRNMKCDVSYDMITCLGEWHDALSDVKSLVEHFPSDHISVYALTLEEGTELFRRKITLPDSDSQYRTLKKIWDFLEDRGFEHYEVSNFAKKGHRSLHNSVYWNYRQYIGVGPSSASTCFKNGKVTRIECPPDVESYVAAQSYTVTPLTAREALEECVIMGLRHTGGLDLKRLKEDFDFEIPFVPAGYAISENHLIPSDSGFMTADATAVALLS